MASSNTSQTNDTIDDEIYPEMDYIRSGTKSDVVFVIDGQRLPAHRLVLELKSKVFRAMFSGHFTESTDNEISIVDTTANAFKTMLRYLYTDELVLSGGSHLEIIGDVLSLADKYDLKRLTNACEQYMKTIISCLSYYDNTTVMYGLATKYGLNQLIQTLKTVIVTNLDKILAKNGNELIALNVATDNWLVPIMAKRLSQTRDFLKDSLSLITIDEGTNKRPCLNRQDGNKYKINYGRKRIKEFNFDDLSIN